MISKLELWGLGLLGALSLALGAYFYGVGVGKNSVHADELKAVAAAEARRDAAEKARDETAERFANLDVQRQNTVREVYREIPKIIQGSPVYRNKCVDDLGVRALDRAAAAANGESDGDAAGGPAEAAEGAAQHRPDHGAGDDHGRPVPRKPG